ncbi:MAG: glycosyltransferase family 4 protein, partial [Myxococcales bacterium]|nr:glycosyltransferase family 4 protein [Myxococcales bacterium]
MKILFLTHYFPPEVNAPANRTHEHARRWAADGHDVTVITGVPNHPRGELFPGYENRWLQREERDGIHVVRTWMYVTANEGFLRRTANYVLFAITAVLASLRVERPDVVVATSPQFFCGLAGAVVSWLRWRPFVLEVRDLWPDSIVQLGQLRSPAIVRVLEAVETALYRSAAGIVVNTRAFIDHIAGRGIARERIELVYNGIDPDLFAPQPRDEALLRANGLEGRRVVAYIGTLGLAHGLRTILDAAERLRGDARIAFALIGDGADRAALEREVAERGLENVHLLGLRPRAEVPAWIASSDVLLVLLRDLPVFETVIPSKLFEFWAQERPIVLAAPDGECRRLVVEADAGT